MEREARGRDVMLFFHNKSTRRLDDVEEDCRKLRREFQALELEWQNAYDKLLTMMQRTAKRAQVAERAEPAVEALPAGVAAGAPTTLTGRAAELQQRILSRRGTHNGGQ